MVKIRLSRKGTKNKPFYSIVVVDSRKARDSGYIEKIGYFNPIAKGAEDRLVLNLDKLVAWQKKGAQLTSKIKQLKKELNNPSIITKRLAKKQLVIKRAAAEKNKLASEKEAKKTTRYKE